MGVSAGRLPIEVGTSFDGIKLQVDVVGLDLTALIDTRQVAE